jgi:hypothetical protein
VNGLLAESRALFKLSFYVIEPYSSSPSVGSISLSRILSISLFSAWDFVV